MKFCLLIMATSLICFSAFAIEAQVATITADVDKDLGVLSLEIVDGRVDSLRIVKFQGQKVLEDESHPVERFLTDGVVASEREGYEIVRLKLENFTQQVGGMVVVDYLVNGATGKRGTYKLKVVKQGPAYGLLTLEGKKVNHLHFKSNKILFKVVGVKSVEVSLR